MAIQDTSKSDKMQATTIYLPSALHRNIRVLAAEKGLRMNKLVTDAIKNWVKQIEAKETAAKGQEDNEAA